MKIADLCQIIGLLAVSIVVFSAPGAAAYTEGAVDSAGSISGLITFNGALPADAVEQIAITKNPEVCGEGYREVVWVDVEAGALRGVFVFIDEIESGKEWSAPDGGNYLVNQEGCRFRPWAQVVQRGEITIRNSDAGVLHNINTREMIGVERGRVVKRTMFNFGQPDPGDLIQEIKPRRSSYISINCEAHNFMFGYMMAPEHPYAVVVGDDGSYSIDNVPPGDYLLKAWHPRLGVQELEITVNGGESTESNFSFSM